MLLAALSICPMASNVTLPETLGIGRAKYWYSSRRENQLEIGERKSPMGEKDD